MNIINPYIFKTDSTLLNGLLMYYAFEESSGTILDSTENNVDGSAVGVTYSNTGKVGNCLGFTNDTVTYTTPYSYNDDITISFWIYFTSMPTSSSAHGIFTDYASGKDYIDIAVWGSSTTGTGDEEFAVFWYGNSSPLTAISNVGLATSTWYHVVYIKDFTNNTLKLYVNTNLEDSNTGPLTYNGSVNTTSKIGDSAFYTGCSARIDEFGVWDRILTTSEISELYNSGSGKTYPFS